MENEFGQPKQVPPTQSEERQSARDEAREARKQAAEDSKEERRDERAESNLLPRVERVSDEEIMRALQEASPTDEGTAEVEEIFNSESPQIDHGQNQVIPANQINYRRDDTTANDPDPGFWTVILDVDGRSGLVNPGTILQNADVDSGLEIANVGGAFAVSAGDIMFLEIVRDDTVDPITFTATLKSESPWTTYPWPWEFTLAPTVVDVPPTINQITYYFPLGYFPTSTTVTQLTSANHLAIYTILAGDIVTGTIANAFELVPSSNGVIIPV